MNDAVKVWAFGHNHFNYEFQDLEIVKGVVTKQGGNYLLHGARYDVGKTVCLVITINAASCSC